MHFVSPILGILMLLATSFAAIPDPEFFVLRTRLGPGQEGKDAFDNLYGIIFLASKNSYEINFVKPRQSEAAQFFGLRKIDTPATDGHPFYDLSYNSTRKSETLIYVVDNIAPMANWQPVLGLPNNSIYNPPPKGGFWLNGTSPNITLQWTNDFKNPDNGYFKGWIVCDWWYPEPQLFARLRSDYYNERTISAGCAEVELMVAPLPNPS